jgi:hydrogenase maturation protease
MLGISRYGIIAKSEILDALSGGDFLGKTLLVGYGNPDREDDGVAWHILNRIAERLGLPEPNQQIDALEHLEDSPDLLCVLQLYPEMAETIADYDRVCFVDAHTGAYQEDIRFGEIERKFQASPFTHHMTPETCLALAETLYGRRMEPIRAPYGVVVSVRGYQFGFSHTLSDRTAELAEVATDWIISWLGSEGP